jgi:hypothetical protein
MLIFLIVVSSEESNPQYLLAKKLSNRRLKRFFKNFDKEQKRHLKELENLEFSKVDETPMHDFGKSKYNTVTIRNNPFDFVNEMIDIAVLNSDVEIFKTAIKSFILLIDKVLSNEIITDADVKFKIHKLVNNSFERFVFSIGERSKNKTLQNIFLENISIYLKRQALIHKQTIEININFVVSLSSFAIKILDQGNRDGALYIVSLNRQLAQKGIYDPPNKHENRFFELQLPTYPIQIKVIGQKAVEMKNSDFLYRCLEELGYLGCTAIKHDDYHVGIECLQSLVQLGREARANNVRCFWTHCMLETIDHADQRIWWMLSWVPQMDEKEQNRWIESFESAYSRLLGFRRKIIRKEINNKIGFEFIDSEEPYIERYTEEHYQKEVDYSDFNEVKEFRLY